MLELILARLHRCCQCDQAATGIQCRCAIGHGDGNEQFGANLLATAAVLGRDHPAERQKQPVTFARRITAFPKQGLNLCQQLARIIVRLASPRRRDQRQRRENPIERSAVNLVSGTARFGHTPIVESAGTFRAMGSSLGRDDMGQALVKDHRRAIILHMPIIAGKAQFRCQQVRNGVIIIDHAGDAL